MPPEVLAISPGPRALSTARGFVDSASSAAGFDEHTRYDIVIAANEAVSNAIEHGAPCDDGHVHLVAGVGDDSFTFSVRDCGEFRHAAVLEPDPVAERGRGFAFMNLMMDEVRLDARPGKTVLHLAKRLPGVPPPIRDLGDAASERNVRVVRELFDAFAVREAARTLELVDRGVMLEPLSTPVERRTPYLGARGVRRYFDDLDSTWDEFRVTVERVRAHADYVVAGGRIRARQASVVIDDPTGFAFRLRDGKVVWAKVYGSEDEALAAAGSN